MRANLVGRQLMKLCATALAAFMTVGVPAQAQTKPALQFEPLSSSRGEGAGLSLAYDNTARPVSPTFFGMTINRIDRYPEWPGLETRVLRLWDTYTRWMDIEPAPGVWRFEVTDRYVEAASRNGAHIVFTLGQPPAWAAADRRAQCHYDAGCSPPASLQDWRNYVRTVATRYGSKIDYYEVWNEPDEPLFYRGSARQLAQLAAIAKEEITRANPEARLLGPGITWKGLGFLSRFLESPGGRSIDALSVHNYVGPSLTDFQRINDSFRDAAARHGASHLPVWVTEFGVWCGPGGYACEAAPSDKAVLQPTKAMLLLAAAGMDNATWYFWERIAPKAPISLARGPAFDRPSEAGEIYGRVAELVAGGTITESWADGDLCVLEFVSRDGTPGVILWAERGPGMLRIPREWESFRFALLPHRSVPTGTEGYLYLPDDALVVGWQS